MFYFLFNKKAGLLRGQGCDGWHNSRSDAKIISSIRDIRHFPCSKAVLANDKQLSSTYNGSWCVCVCVCVCVSSTANSSPSSPLLSLKSEVFRQRCAIT